MSLANNPQMAWMVPPGFSIDGGCSSACNSWSSWAVPLSLTLKATKEAVDVSEILLLETDGEKILWTYKRRGLLRSGSKLTELEEILPIAFCSSPSRPSSIPSRFIPLKNLFREPKYSKLYQTHKQVHVSWHYYQLLKERLKEMR